jgi:hypothetical protein
LLFGELPYLFSTKTKQQKQNKQTTKQQTTNNKQQTINNKQQRFPDLLGLLAACCWTCVSPFFADFNKPDSMGAAWECDLP